MGVMGLLLLAGNAAAANYYVRAAATGTRDGSDWVNANTNLPSGLTRGNTYYVASGAYTSHTFNDADSGTTQITVQKATVASHGTATGWSDSYATGQASFIAPLLFTSDNYTVSGVSRTDLRTGHGFLVDNTSKGVAGNGCLWVGTSNPQYGSNITLLYIEVKGSGDRTGSTGDVGLQVLWGSHFVTMEYCALHDFGNCCVFQRQTFGTTYQYNWFNRNHSTGAAHAEGISTSEGVGNWTCAYNVFEDIEGTACIASASGTSGLNNTNWWIYGNCFTYNSSNRARTGTDQTGGCGNGVLALFDQNFYGDVFFYNNTIVNFNDYAVGGPIGGDNVTDSKWTDAGVEIGLGFSTPIHDRFYAFNNYWYKSPGDINWSPPGSSGITDYKWQYNTYSDSNYSDATAPYDTGTGAQHTTGSPFTDWVNLNFHLAGATTAGTTLASPFNVDPDGITRGADGTWDRGTYDFVAGGGGITFGLSITNR